MPLETDEFLDAVKKILTGEIPTMINGAAVAGIAELTDKGVAVWHAGDSDPIDDIANGIAKCKGVSVLIYDLGGNAEPEDVIDARAVVELFIDTTKHSRKRNPELRYPSQIRVAIMQLLHRNLALRNLSPSWSCRVKGYTPLEDPDYVAWRITISHSIYLISDS